MDLCLHPSTYVGITSLSASVIEGGRNNVVGIATRSPRRLMYSGNWVFPGVKGPERDSDHPVPFGAICKQVGAIPSRYLCACIRNQLVDLYLLLFSRTKSEKYCCYIEIIARHLCCILRTAVYCALLYSAHCCILHTSGHVPGTLQANFVYAVTLNEDFKYRDLYVSIF